AKAIDEGWATQLGILEATGQAVQDVRRLSSWL
ncbi:hypothetical protein A2U01_0077572, partial [Trifolium medium]|nr:hypothetical protein [Trifolium medium]